MKKMKLSSKAVLSLVLSAVLFCMPALGFAMNGNYAVSVHAEDTDPESSSEENRTENDTEQETESGSEENSTEEDTVSGGDVKEPECTCEDKCGAYEYDHNCEVCVKDYKLCAYKKPNVTIQINQPDGWHNDKASVTFTVADVAHTGNFEIAKIQAKVGQNGSWTDVTEDRKLEVSENCTVYVQVTDQKGNTYERSRAIKCFDTTKPTLNAAVSDGLLSVQVHDTDSGAKAVYVNGYEFTELTNGTLNIRLQQFDAGYEYFTISAMDNAGNMSEVYKTKVLEGTKKVVNDSHGTGHAAHRDDIVLAGKTGTAEIKASKDDTSGTELGWFAIYSTEETVEHPILIISMVEDVKGRGGSGYVVKKDSAVLEDWFHSN